MYIYTLTNLAKKRHQTSQANYSSSDPTKELLSSNLTADFIFKLIYAVMQSVLTIKKKLEHLSLSESISRAHFLNPIVSNQIASVTSVATKVISRAEPLKVRTAIARPDNVQLRFNVSLIAVINQFQNFLIIILFS